MKICLVTNEYPPQSHTGGIGTRFRNLALGFVSLGHKVSVITRIEGRGNSVSDEDGVRVYRISPSQIALRGFWRIEGVLPSTVSRLSYSACVSRKLHELIRADQVDVAISPEWGAELFWFALAPGRKRVPLVVSVSGPSFVMNRFADGKRRLDLLLTEWLEKILLLRADAIHAVSAQVAREVSEKYRLPMNRFRVIHNPVDTRIFAPDPSAKITGKTLLYVGRLEERKGVGILAAALRIVHKTHPDARCVFIGRDMSGRIQGASMRFYLLKLLDDSGSRVEFHDHMSHEKLVSFYQKADIGIFPSLSEPSGNVCLEAMACGKPVILTKNSGLWEVLQDRFIGLSVNAGDATGLAKTIVELLNDEALRETLGARARKTAEDHFSTHRIVPQWLELIESARPGTVSSSN